MYIFVYISYTNLQNNNSFSSLVFQKCFSPSTKLFMGTVDSERLSNLLKGNTQVSKEAETQPTPSDSKLSILSIILVKFAVSSTFYIEL